MAKSWKASCPSNIALIKYMGKKDYEKNIPTNASISWTLEYLVSTVVLVEAESDSWTPLPSDFPFQLTASGKVKFLNHLNRIKDVFEIQQNFQVQSANNFPADCGIASSASSFAALTAVCVKAFSELTGRTLAVEEVAQLSARGSGSSCRSFMGGLVEWNDHGIQNVESDLKGLLHMVVIVGDGAKKVSSSEAHKRVATSSLFPTRVERSNQRMEHLKQQIQPLDWKALYENVWAEFWDMHALFETCTEPFGYFLPGSTEVLNNARLFWKENGDGPVVTMDAGPNIHLLWRMDQKKLALKFYSEYLENQWTCLSNIAEIGFARI